MLVVWSTMAVLGIVGTFAFGVWLTGRLRERRLLWARADFHRRREYLEAKFFELASSSGRPRGLDWVGIDFENEVTYARDRKTGDLAAFVGVTIKFAATPGGGMEDVEAVDNLRAATSVFLLHRGKWRTEGRTIFNLNPVEAIQRFDQSLERVPAPIKRPVTGRVV